MPLILVEARGEPDGFERRVQHDPTIAADLLRACEAALPEAQRLRDCLAKVHDGYPDELRAADARLNDLRAVIARAKGGETEGADHGRGYG